MAETKKTDAEDAFSSNSRDASSPTGVYVKWIALILAVAALVGFVGIKPSLEGYFKNNAATTAQLDQNISNQQKKTELLAQFKNLDATKSEVKTFLNSFPETPSQEAMVNELNGIAAKNGVKITAITPSAAAIIGADGKPVQQAAVAPAADGSTPAAKPAAPAGSLLGTIGLTISVSGNNVNGFIADVENANRVFLINSLTYNDDGKDTKNVTLNASTFIVSPITEPVPPQIAE